mmetsp:Transcript_23741/g.36624  ORF Transcript_23741/g.36624 Transcript_23741/m.36624 type:complete len:534 (+) Transcript_23741:271-1872(+)|eukprot:CAMPEP_0196817526 /NCGR_PEP_ID=MMETSP1362-20130617/61243_1 /TAXON_ID=163516 /ORGANISM="Leptocylindrus danicus, Strain CCMP1856" /LENGTH=533 /DNA_ID=CAMNT_0042195259 /DNA_START=232 /DNA_END=1833 /DNA_ORIENTATION=-
MITGVLIAYAHICCALFSRIILPIQASNLRNGINGKERATISANGESSSDRDLWGWGTSNHDGDPYTNPATDGDPTGDYEPFAQGYRMLGAFISCGGFADAGSGDHRQRNRQRGRQERDRMLSGSGDGNDECGRWILWAAYVNTEYQGGGAEEYYEGGESELNCYDDSEESTWELIGIYRTDVDNFLEQMGKHLWVIGSYEYHSIYAALDYIDGGDCKETGQYDSSGNAIYAALQPTYGGRFQMGLYTDEKCIYNANNAKFSFDDLGWGTDFDGGSGDDDGYNNDSTQAYWKNAQEQSLTNLNGILDDYRDCALCLDYPSYQDGELNGDGYDEDDLINQCWKFWSHGTYPCDGECLEVAHKQGTINTVTYGGSTYGSTYTGSPSHSSSNGGVASTVYLTLSTIVLVATSLSFVASRGAKRKSRRSRGGGDRIVRSNTADESLLDDATHKSNRSSRGKRGQREERSDSRKEKSRRSRRRNEEVTPQENVYHTAPDEPEQRKLSKEERRRRRERRKAVRDRAGSFERPGGSFEYT